MFQKRAVITGMGAVTPAGTGWKQTWQSLLKGRSGIRSISLFNTDGYRTRIAGEVSNLKLPTIISEKLKASTERFTHFALAATHQAHEQRASVPAPCAFWMRPPSPWPW
jgi:3-oxoacyl-[acyl-carrier-protein] synthase II